MAAEVLTPIDEIGMPLPLAPTNLEILDASQQKPDWHHHFHPRRSPLLTEDEGGKAVRNARVQKANWTQHHIEYHGYYEGPPLPETDAQKFGLVVLATAGYVPSEAIDFTSDGPKIVTISSAQRNRLWKSGELKSAAPDSVRKFILNYTLGQNLTEVNEKMVDEFIDTKNKDRRYTLGGTLLDIAIRRAVEPLDPFYRTAWGNGLINRSSAQRPVRLVKAKIDYKRQRPLLISRLHQVLAAA